MSRMELVRICSRIAERINSHIGIIVSHKRDKRTSRQFADVSLTGTVMVHNHQGIWTKELHHDAIDRSKDGHTKKIVQIIGYDFRTHTQYETALFLARQVKHTTQYLAAAVTECRSSDASPSCRDAPVPAHCYAPASSRSATSVYINPLLASRFEWFRKVFWVK